MGFLEDGMLSLKTVWKLLGPTGSEERVLGGLEPL
jgi:hypothetical protein